MNSMRAAGRQDGSKSENADPADGRRRVLLRSRGSFLPQHKTLPTTLPERSALPPAQP
jgi:hypothetical protein